MIRFPLTRLPTSLFFPRRSVLFFENPHNLVPSFQLLASDAEVVPCGHPGIAWCDSDRDETGAGSAFGTTAQYSPKKPGMWFVVI